jgi:two-component system phosphate regulon sensor histidine kinase PhoR
MPEPCEKSELLVCGQRVFRAVAIIQQTTTAHFLRLADERVAERESRLRAFNRSVSHEIKNRIGAVLGASETLREIPDASREERERFLAIISKHARGLQHTVENLIALSRLDKDARQHRHVRLPEAVREACRQVREAAQAAGLDVRVAGDIPDVEVNAAAVELCLTNYVSNAIKYVDPAKPDHFASVSAAIEQAPGDAGREVVVRVRDNGLGVPADKRDRLFERFFRAHETVTDAEGTGLGLSIVRDTIASIGGRAWAEFPADGSVFAFSMPYRREGKS